MSTAAIADGFLPRQREPAFAPSFALSMLMHAALVAVLVFGVRFQSSRPATVEVELWEAPPPPAPVVEEKPAPPPPKVEPEPEVKKPPEIAEAQKAKPKPKPKPEPKKAEPKRDPSFEKRMREQVALEQKKLAQERSERELREMIARQQAEARLRALAQWTDRIRAKIRGNIILPPGIPGNPEAVFDVSLLPTGEVLTARQRRSSGHAAYDDAVHRAILKSSPLPKPDDPRLFERQLELRFRPLDK